MSGYMSVDGTPPKYGNVAPTHADIQAIADLVESLAQMPPTVAVQMLEEARVDRVLKAYCDQFVGVAEASE